MKYAIYNYLRPSTETGNRLLIAAIKYTNGNDAKRGRTTTSGKSRNCCEYGNFVWLCEWFDFTPIEAASLLYCQMNV